MKKLFITISILFFSVPLLFSLNTEKKPLLQEKQQIEKIVSLTPDNFEKNASKYIGRTIYITGIVDHVCEHGGKKMFLVDEKSDERVKITTNDDMAAFKQDMVGETVKVTGIIEEMKIDEEYINNMESKSKDGIKQKGNGLHVKGEHVEHDEKDSQSNKINNLRKMLKESGKDYLSFFYVVATNYEIIK